MILCKVCKVIYFKYFVFDGSIHGNMWEETLELQQDEDQPIIAVVTPVRGDISTKTIPYKYACPKCYEECLELNKELSEHYHNIMLFTLLGYAPRLQNTYVETFCQLRSMVTDKEKDLIKLSDLSVIELIQVKKYLKVLDRFVMGGQNASL